MYIIWMLDTYLPPFTAANGIPHESQVRGWSTKGVTSKKHAGEMQCLCSVLSIAVLLYLVCMSCTT